MSLNMTTNIDELLLSLRGVGFSKNEALVYLAVLELGPSSIWDIAKKSNIKRPTCYVLLEELTYRGYASSTNDGKRTIYTVISPKQLQRSIERRHTKFSSSISQLEAIATRSPYKPVIRLYEGVEGVMGVYNLSLNEPKGSEILTYGTATVGITYGNFIAEYLTHRTEKGIMVRAILPDNEINRQASLSDKQELRQTRFLPEDVYNQTTEINIFGDKIAYIAHSEKQPFATLVENPTLAREEQQRFEIIWKVARSSSLT